MTCRILRFPRARIVALAVGVGALGSLATAPASLANPPAAGINCQLDGKISGRGSTFQNNALNKALITGFTSDVCGPVGTASNLNAGYGGTDPAGSGMIAYNYSQAGTAVKNGSGQGIAAMECRTDPFGGTDLPYNGTQLTQMNSAPGTGQTSCTPNVSPPYPPQSPFPNPGDTTPANGVMSFPIAGGAVASAINLNGVCSPVPTNINLTSKEFEAIWQGTINQWNDSNLVATNPILATDHCTGPIQRIVRTDNSGTSAITKTHANGINQATLCDGTTQAAGTFGAWATLAANSPNNVWPTGPNCKDANNNVAPAVYGAGVFAVGTTAATNSGSGPLIALLDSTTTPTGDPTRASNTCPGGTTNSCGGEGGIGYAELGLWPAPLPAGVSFVHIESKAGTVANGINNNTPPANVFITPGSPGAKSNCNVGSNGLPGSASPSESVGLGGADDNWANDSGADVPDPTLQFENVTYSGSGYPTCGLTFDFVYTGMSSEPSTTYVGMTNDQLRTLYSYFTYVFSPLGQSYLDAQTYDELPGAWLSTLRAGYQANS